MVAVAGNGHKANGSIESDNRVLHRYINRRFAENRKTLGPVSTCERRGLFGADKVNRAWILVYVQCILVNAPNCQETDRPQVNLVVVFVLTDGSQCHPARCTDAGCTLLPFLGDFSAETEIRQFKLAVRGAEGVIRFDGDADSSSHA